MPGSDKPQIKKKFPKAIGGHLGRALKTESESVSRTQMLLCGIATGFPLFVGLYRGQLTIAIYGGLMGYFLTVYDHVGTVRHRLWMATITFVMLTFGFFFGIYLQGHNVQFLLALGILSYWIGLMFGRGVELERATLFTLIQAIIAAHILNLATDRAHQILIYYIITYLFVLAAIVMRALLFKHRPPPYMRVREAVLALSPFDSTWISHIHAFSYSAMTLLATFLAEHYQVERGYWMIITVLLVMKPDPAQSLYRSFQRFFGTCCGVLASVALIYFFRTPLPIVVFITGCAFFVPWAIKKNYWLVAFLISIIVILMIDIPAVQRGDYHTPFLRLRATAYGSLLTALGAMLSRVLEIVFLKRVRAAN